MKVSKDFIIQEFVPPIIYRRYGPKSIWFIRPEVIKLAQFYRDWFATPIIINTWAFGDWRLTQRGYRVPNSRTGSTYSQHKLAAAFDCHGRTITAPEMRKEILDNEADFMLAGLTTLESGEFAPTWVHSDIRPTRLDHILIVKP